MSNFTGSLQILQSVILQNAVDDGQGLWKWKVAYLQLAICILHTWTLSRFTEVIWNATVLGIAFKVVQCGNCTPSLTFPLAHAVSISISAVKGHAWMWWHNGKAKRKIQRERKSETHHCARVYVHVRWCWWGGDKQPGSNKINNTTVGKNLMKKAHHIRQEFSQFPQFL